MVKIEVCMINNKCWKVFDMENRTVNVWKGNREIVLISMIILPNSNQSFCLEI